MTQTDIGYDTKKKLWYIESYTPNREFLGVQLVHDANLKLENVIGDTYAWNPNPNEATKISQGRLRFFDQDKCEIHKRGAVADSIKVTGQYKLNFQEVKTEGDVAVFFNLESMNWSLMIGDGRYTTQNMVFEMTGELSEQRKNFIIKNPKSILYSPILTLVNSNLEIQDA
jgi:hypothetical protein